VPGRGMGNDCGRAEVRRPHTVWIPASSIPRSKLLSRPQGPHWYPREPLSRAPPPFQWIFDDTLK
jgi:hypothetical protein